MRIKENGNWRQGLTRYKHPSVGWLSPDRQYVKVGNLWKRTYDDPNVVVETFESGNIFTEGVTTATRQASSAFSGGYGLRVYSEHDTYRTRLTSTALNNLTGIYRYEALIRPVSTTWPNNLAGIAFCGDSADPAAVYVALIDRRNDPSAPSTRGLQLRYGSGWNGIMAGNDLPVNLDQWYRMVVTHNQNTGLIVIVVEDLNGALLAKLSHTDTRLKGGRFGVFTVGAHDFDNVSREQIG